MIDTTSTLRTALVGYGRMGREIERLAAAEGFEIAARCDVDTAIGAAELNDVDVAIEFTHPDAAVANIIALVEAGTPVVVGTTGWLAHLAEIRSAVEAHSGRVIYASNFSIGVNIFFKLARAAGRIINDHALYDAAVHEAHHVRKADAPSGTALTIARILLDEIARKDDILSETSHGRIDPTHLHVTSQRIGETVGTHVVTFDSSADTIELVHRAKDRSGFALGALMAARWIVGQPPGLYRFEDLFV